MADWEERVTSGSQPTLRLEHTVRYAAAEPIVSAGETWCDLGCGTAAGSAGPLGAFGGRAVLVDVAEDAVAEACRRFPHAETEGLVADLASAEGIALVRSALAGTSNGCVTCFEVIEHLSLFAPVVELLVDLTAQAGYTVALSVPNDGFWSMENPFHLSRWSEGAFAELTSVLPADHVVAYQTQLAGSAVLRGPSTVALETEMRPTNVPTHFIVAFGPRASLLAAPAAIVASDLDAQRAWERQREADLAHFKSLAKRRR
jgi:hypothetical protein